MQIWNGSDEYCWRYRTDTILSTDGQTDWRTKLKQYTGGYNDNDYNHNNDTDNDNNENDNDKTAQTPCQSLYKDRRI